MTASHTAICPSCHAPVSGESRFCPQCGASVSGISPSLTGDWRPTAQAPVASSPWDTVLARLRQTTIGEFDIGRELGRGGMAAVFLAHDLALNRKVAIKVMSPGLLMGAGMIERFRQEAVTIANLQHANIVTVHAVRQREDLHFFVMQFIEGQSLEGVLRDNRTLPLELVRPIMYQMGTALAYAHRRGVVHRDVKPGNVLLSGDGDALVTDFGIAKVAAGPTQTATGMVVGTPSYMSPEQCHAEELDGKSDQYSLGIVAYQMLTGTVPFTGSTFAIMHGHTSQPVPSIRDLVPSVPESVEQAIVRMLAKKASDRFATLAEALQALQARPVGEDTPERNELIRLAAVEERRAELGDLLRTPGSPVPRSRAVPTPTALRTASEPLSIEITPVGHTLESGEQAMLHASVRGPANAGNVRWSSDNPDIAAVQPDTGAVYAMAPGTAVVRASVGDVSAEIRLPVAPPHVATLRITPATVSLRAGEQLQLKVDLLDRRGLPLQRQVVWSARGESAHVDSLGMLTALMSGTATITVACEGVQESVAVEVRPMVAATDGPSAAGGSVTKLMAASVATDTPAPTPVRLPTPAASLPPVAPPAAIAPPPIERTVAMPAAPSRTPERVVPQPAATDASGTGTKRGVPVPAIVGGVLVLAAVGWFATRGGSTAEAPAAVASVASPEVKADSDSVAGPVINPPPVSPEPIQESPSSGDETTTPAAVTLALRVVPPRSRELRVGETLRLRATVENTATRETVVGVPIRFETSDRRLAVVDWRTGEVTAVNAGAVSISISVGGRPEAGRSRVDLVVREAPRRDDVVVEPVNPGPTVVIKKPDPTPNPPINNGGGVVTPGPAAVTISQTQLASEARTVVVSFARAIESRDMGVVKALFPGISSQYASDLSEMFEASKSVKVSVNNVAVRGGGTYDATPGTRTNIAASVTFRFVPVRGNPSSSEDTWPITLLREASGWKVVQVSSQ